MLEEYWKSKIYFINLFGIVVTVGALFLNIESPENINARNALYYIQMIFLLSITLLFIFAWIDFHKFTKKLDKVIESRIDMDLGDRITDFIFFIGLFVIYNLWVYTYYLYKPQISSLLGTLSTPILTLSLYLSLNYIFRFFNKYKKLNFIFLLKSLAVLLITSMIPSFWFRLAEFKFDILAFIVSLSFFYLIQLFIFGIIIVADHVLKSFTSHRIFSEI